MLFLIKLKLIGLKNSTYNNRVNFRKIMDIREKITININNKTLNINLILEKINVKK
jgi:hypothetical protein